MKGTLKIYITNQIDKIIQGKRTITISNQLTTDIEPVYVDPPIVAFIKKNLAWIIPAVIIIGIIIIVVISNIKK